MITLEEKEVERQKMVNSGLTTIETEIPNGPKVKWLKCWDYKADLQGITFKSQTKPPVQHSLLEIKEMNLAPVQNLIFWQVTILRQPRVDIKPNPKVPM